MKGSFTTLVLVMLLFFGVALVAETHLGEPVTGCPKLFTVHSVADHDQHHEGHHIGSDTDRNGDGYICVKPLPDGLHLHIDNDVLLK